MRRDRTLLYLTAALVILIAIGPVLPQWALSFVSVVLYLGIVVLGMALLMRTGLVSFGQGLYYCLGAYAAGATPVLIGLVESFGRSFPQPQWMPLRLVLNAFSGALRLIQTPFGPSDLLTMVLAGALLAVAVAAVLGLLLARYRGIFFAMLSLAFSMILYGLLVRTSELGSTDGFGLSVKSFAGIALSSHWARYTIYAFSAVTAFACAIALHRYSFSYRGRLAGAIRDNELRVEYMGASVRNVIHLNYIISAALAGVGGALMAATIGHVDPETTANWTTSGDFVFITILSGTGSVLAPFLGAGIFEAVRTFALQYVPNTWQMTLGITMLLVIMFLPDGLWSVFVRQRRSA